MRAASPDSGAFTARIMGCQGTTRLCLRECLREVKLRGPPQRPSSPSGRVLTACSRSIGGRDSVLSRPCRSRLAAGRHASLFERSKSRHLTSYRKHCTASVLSTRPTCNRPDCKIGGVRMWGDRVMILLLWRCFARRRDRAGRLQCRTMRSMPIAMSAEAPNELFWHARQ